MSLLRVKVEYPAVWEGFQPYLSNLPGEEDVHTLFSFRKDLIPLLQDPEMVRPRRAVVSQCTCIGRRWTSEYADDVLSQACCVYQHRYLSVLQTVCP